MKKFIILLIALALIPNVSFGAQYFSQFSSPSSTTPIISPGRISNIDPPIKATYFTATSTTASTFPYASSTVFSAPTICISTDCRTTWPSGGGSGGGTWSTTTSSVPGRLVNYSNNTTDIIVIGATATGSAKFYFDPNTQTSVIPYASSTALTVSGNVYTGVLSVNGGTAATPFAVKNGTTNLFHVTRNSDANVSFSIANTVALQTVCIVNCSLYWGNDANISDQTFRILGVDKAIITSTGVGIGTSSPYAPLSVLGQVVASYFTATTSTASTFPYASTTAITSTTASSTNLIVSSAGGTAGCATFSTNGTISNTGTACGSGSGGTFPFTTTTSFGTTANSTSTLLLLTNGLSASTTVRFGNAGVNNQFLFDGTTGNLGLGSSTPWAQLSVNPNGITGPEFAIGSSTRTHFVVKNNGFVGVGNSNPQASLHVNTNDGSGLAFKMTGLSTDGTSDTANGAGIYLSHNLSGNRQIVLADTETVIGVRVLGNTLDGYNNGSRANLTLQNDTTDVTVGRSMFVTSTLGVGGTTTPSATLGVVGGAYIGGNAFIAGTVTSTSTASSTIPRLNVTDVCTPTNCLSSVNSSQNVQVFTSSGTFTVPSGYTKFHVRVLGGGGGGSACVSCGTSQSGGGSGGFLEGWFDLTGTSSVAVTIGAGGASNNTGGTSYFGATNNAYASSTGGAVGGLGGTSFATTSAATIATINGTGMSGDIGATVTGYTVSGNGGSSPYGGGGTGVGGATDGVVGTGYGSGGSGAGSIGAGTRNGGAGTGGLVIVEGYK